MTYDKYDMRRALLWALVVALMLLFMADSIPRGTVAEIVARTRREQGLPPTVTDPLVIRKLARAIVARRPRDVPVRPSDVERPDDV